MIKITLNEKYKSFDKGFETVLDGNLIILSGVNGSGKSQLMNIIYGESKEELNMNSPMPHMNNNKKDITRNIHAGDISIDKRNIELRSFKDNITIPEIVKASSYTFSNSAKQAYDFYKQNNYNLDTLRNPQYSKSIEKIKEILKKVHRTSLNSLSEEKFKDALIDARFEWKPDDIFTDFIGNIFFDHATKIAQGQQDAGKVTGPAFDPMTLGIAPWNELNELFEILKLDYRFKNDYEIKHGELKNTPILFQIDANGLINGRETRPLKDLSDGEKAIISLCFTSLKKIDTDNIKILLLDEFDAALNPSLIEGLFEVVKKYFLDKGIIVIMSTHSPATISLAPEYASFYEVFKKNYSATRVYRVSKDDYTELQKVNKKFYDKIGDQEKRIKELEVVIDSQEDILIITEGKTDWKYIVKALQYFHSKKEFLNIKQEYFYRFGSKEDVNIALCGTNIYADMGESQLNNFLANEINSRIGDSAKRKQKRIGIFDSDTDIKPKSKNEYGVFSFKITPNNISTEFLFNDPDLKAEISGERLFIGLEFDERSTRHESLNLNLGSGSSKRAGKKEIIDLDVFDENNQNKALSKEKFAQAIYNDEIKISNDSWENFRHIFEKLEEILYGQN